MKLGLKLIAEGFGPKELVRQAVRAEQAGFDFVEMSECAHPGLYAGKAPRRSWRATGLPAPDPRTSRGPCLGSFYAPRGSSRETRVAAPGARTATRQQGEQRSRDSHCAARVVSNAAAISGSGTVTANCLGARRGDLVEPKLPQR